MKYLILLPAILITSCWPHAERQINADAPSDQTTGIFAPLPVEDTIYMPTGFYFISPDSMGVRKRMERSNEVYIIDKIPFMSVDNIISTKLKATANESDSSYELCLTFDFIGTKNFEKGIGNPQHKKIAAIVANRLLYVVDSNENTEAMGSMCLSLSGYSENEMEQMKSAVDHKR